MMNKKGFGLLPVVIIVVTVFVFVAGGFAYKYVASMSDGDDEAINDPYSDCFVRFEFDTTKHDFQYCEMLRESLIKNGQPVCEAQCRLNDERGVWELYFKEATE